MRVFGQIVQEGVSLRNLGELDQLLWRTEKRSPVLKESVAYGFLVHLRSANFGLYGFRIGPPDPSPLKANPWDFEHPFRPD
jgi:hypothetical protein